MSLRRNPALQTNNTQRYKNGSKLPISESKQETAGHSLSLPKFFNCGKKDFSGPLSCSCDFLTEKQGNKPPMGIKFKEFEPEFSQKKSAILILP
ncbi:hypothetical protein AVEN_96918-1 [Araneus ventricosus]|uniref:Uncharacterized protein n=1 Tax=Araneus ventricosus TaxID=182803 RepID=A0A4Y2GRV3_ARAVE|nr:hypothetical protein AVEN_96918-1 [Araneus ventricosus]